MSMTKEESTISIDILTDPKTKSCFETFSLSLPFCCNLISTSKKRIAKSPQPSRMRILVSFALPLLSLNRSGIMPAKHGVSDPPEGEMRAEKMMSTANKAQN